MSNNDSTSYLEDAAFNVPVPISNQQWIEFVFQSLPQGVAPVYAAFEENPSELSEFEKGRCFGGRGVGAEYRGWGTVVYRDVAAEMNTYINVGSFKVQVDGKVQGYKKSAASYYALHAVFIDDVFNKHQPQPWWPMPSLRIATSKNNEQWWYVLRDPILSYQKATQFVNAFVKRVPNDGMGAIRWGRLPVGANTKYDPPFAHTCPGGSMKRFSVERMIQLFGLVLEPIPEPRAKNGDTPDNALAWEHKRKATLLANWIRNRRLVKREYEDSLEIVCPLMTGHDNGPGTRFWLPSEQNEWRGGFNCQHTKCKGKTLGDLYRWAEADMRRVLESKITE